MEWDSNIQRGGDARGSGGGGKEHLGCEVFTGKGLKAGDLMSVSHAVVKVP